MRWSPGRSRGDVVDRRGASGFRGGGMRMGLGGMVVLLILSLVFGKNFFSLADTAVAPGAQTTGDGGPVVSTPAEDSLYQFVDWVVGDAQDAWSNIFQQAGAPYQRAKVVVYRDLYQSACGTANAAVGPFYCPADNQVYLDLGFFEQLHQRFGAPGDFAQAYVVAHELGHHVQTILGGEAELREMQRRRPDLSNDLSVRFELQADCYAGVWGHTTARRDLLDPGDVEEGLAAAAAIGDDQLQRMGGGTVQPESFTHGTSEQRMQWFRRGLETGDPEQCDTFAG